MPTGIMGEAGQKITKALWSLYGRTGCWIRWYRACAGISENQIFAGQESSAVFVSGQF
jgi:hypothetical protein